MQTIEKPGSVESPSKPQEGGILLMCDMEGPHLKQDTARETFSRFIRPTDTRTKSPVDYGGLLFDEIYDWYMKTIYSKRVGEEGSDMALSGALLLARGVTQEDLNKVAADSLQTPGSREFIDKLHDNGTHVVGITTAWEGAHKPLTNKIGFDELIGTLFPIDELRAQWTASPTYNKEQKLADKFLNDCFDAIDTGKNGSEKLHQLMSTFYEDTLGVSFDPSVRQKRPGYKTALAKIIEEMDVVGDISKVRMAKEKFRQKSEAYSLKAAVGDGLNDFYMLSEAPFSIAFNGPSAVRAATIGVVANEVSIVADLLLLRAKNPSLNIDDFVNLAKQLPAVQNGEAVVHKAGADVDSQFIALHAEKRKEMRGVGSNIP